MWLTVSWNDEEEDRGDGSHTSLLSDTLYWVVHHSWYWYTQVGERLAFKHYVWKQNQSSLNHNITFTECLSHPLCSMGEESMTMQPRWGLPTT